MQTGLVALVLVAVCGGAVAQPFGQGFPDQRSETRVRSQQLAAYNQLGILQFCQGQGTIDETIVALQRKAIEELRSASTPELASAEAAGKTGIIVFETSRVTMSMAAIGNGSTVASRCKQIALTVQAQAGIEPTW